MKPLFLQNTWKYQFGVSIIYGTAINLLNIKTYLIANFSLCKINHSYLFMYILKIVCDWKITGRLHFSALIWMYVRSARHVSSRHCHHEGIHVPDINKIPKVLSTQSKTFTTVKNALEFSTLLFSERKTLLFISHWSPSYFTLIHAILNHRAF